MSNQTATLTAYTPTGTMTWVTNDYGQVLRFKRTCAEVDCEYTVSFTKKSEPYKQKAKVWYKNLFT